MVAIRGAPESHLWRPASLVDVVRDARRSRRSRSVLVAWALFTCLCAVAAVTVARIGGDGIGMPTAAGDVRLGFSVSLLLCTFALLWLGLEWAAVPAAVAAAAAAVAAGLGWPWVLAVALLHPLALAIVALVYRAVPLRVDMRSGAAACGFVAIALAAWFVASATALVEAAARHTELAAAHRLWVGTWVGLVLQTALVNLPVLLLLGRRAETLRRRFLPAVRRPKVDSRWVVLAVSAVCTAVLFFVVANGWLATAGLGSGLTGTPAGSAEDSEALASLRLLTFNGALLTLFAALGVVLLAVRWSNTLQAEVEARTADLADSRGRYALAAEASNDGLWDWDLAARRIVFSRRWLEMLGMAPGEMGDSIDDWLGLAHPDERNQLEVALNAHIEGHTSSFEGEFRLRHRDGSYRWMLARGLCARDDDGRARRMAGSLTDITERKNTEQQLVHDALHDELTGLPNRALFMDRLSGAIARSLRQSGYLYSVLFLDLDRFKVINDTLGHSVGDVLLVEIAERLTACLRPVDTVARLGGDEFAILLDNISTTQNATELADRIHQQLSRPFFIDGNDVFTSASIGIASSRTGYSGPEDVLRDADTAMYRAKSLGKARHQVFDTAMHAQTLRLLLLESDLQQATERDQLSLHYQPVLSLPDREIVGFEALLRWNHPKWGAVPQVDFLPLAEETGLIVPIGEWVLDQACRQLAQWRARHTGLAAATMSVNLSQRQLVHAGLVEQVERALGSAGLDAGSLRLEATEEALTEDAGTAQEAVLALKTRGAAVDLDDYGTGPASLKCLYALPIDGLKIDRSLVAAMTSNPKTLEVVKAVVGLARALGLVVVAEGVESQVQVDALVEMGCHRAQGFHLSGPGTASEVDDTLG